MLNDNTLKLLNDILKKVNVDDISPDSDAFEDLKDGYYLCEVETAECKDTKTTGLPMAAFRFTVVEDGLLTVVDEDGNVNLVPAKGSKNRKIFQNYLLKDEKSITRFIRDMLKFEGEKEGESLLPKEAFLEGEVMSDAVEALVGQRIYIQISSSVNDDSVSVWRNLISWSKAKALDLPM